MITSLLILLLVVTLPTIVHISRIITRMPRRARRMKRITSSYKSRVLSYGRTCFYKCCINCLIFTLRQISRLSFLATRVLSFHRRIYDWIRNVLGLLEPVIHVNSVYNLVALSMHDYNNSGQWCIDSGASIHICNDRSMFSDFNADAPTMEISGVSTKKLMTQGVGTVRLPVVDVKTNTVHNIVLTDVQYLPG